ncbi:MAG TPA: M48 family metalloprotease [Vicinamibacteria bacterium]|nr:M48 family metalloprotease [Vicinamibacteria bacterium]
MLVSEAQEIQIGRAADAESVASYGLYPDEAVQDYLARLGAEMAARSERPDLPWTFRVLDDPVVNAFALPGGFIYMTRGIMAHLGSEAQLMAVVGHEIGHVTARHSAAQISRAQLATLGLGVGMIARPDLAERFGGLAQGGFGLLLLKFGRDAEREADDLGLRYLERSGYDGTEMVQVFRVLRRVGEEGASQRLPGWLSTHPDPEDRIERTSGRLASEAAAGGTVAREAYLERLDGMVFGDDPREGFFRDGVFYHPGLRFRLELPRDWTTRNEKQAVVAVSPARDAAVTLTLAKGSPDAAAREFFAAVAADGARRTEVNGLPAVGGRFEAATREARLRGRALFLSHEERTFRLLAYALAARWSRYEEDAEAALGSFQRLSERRWLEVEPRRLRLVRLDRAMTLAEFAERHPSTVPLEMLARINQVEAEDPLPRSLPVKRVIGGPPED